MKRLTQHERILATLKECGSRGMNSFTWRHAFIQLPVRIMELKAKGYLITTRHNDDKSVDYILLGKSDSFKYEDKEEPKFHYEYSGNVAYKVYES